MSEKCQPLSLVLQAILIITLCCCDGTSITLSPLGMVSVCPGGQVLLTCERMSGSFLYWTVSVPHLATRESIISSAGVVRTTYVQFNELLSTAFNITRTSSSPLTSQMMVNNVTTMVNGSTIYCSENSNENGAPMATINVINEESDNPLNVTMVNHFLRDSVTVTLQWPQKDGEVYNINVTPHTELTNKTLMRHDSFVINLTISYNIQYNVSIVSSLCDVTTTKVLNYVTCDLPSQLLERPVIVDAGSRVIPHREGQFITYTCPPGLVLNGPNASVCTGNREWEPDPGEVDCILLADCGVPSVNINVKQNYNSTLEGSVLILTCENAIDISSNITDEEILNVTCHSSGSWIPDPAQFNCSPSTTTVHVPPGFTTEIWNISLIIVVIVSGVVLITVLMGLLLIITCVIKRKCVVTKTSKTSKNDLWNQEPTYEEVSDTHHKGIQMEGNAAYGHMI